MKYGPTNAAIAYLNDQGSPAQNLPARPFMLPGIDNARVDLQRVFELGGRETLDGVDGAAPRMLNRAGLVAQRSIRLKIVNGPFAPLSPRTLAARRSRRPPNTSTTPLRDTGQLLRSINYVVRRDP